MTTPASVVRVDWWQILTDLQRFGYSHRMVARALVDEQGGCVAVSTVHDWKGGAEPRHEQGERLIAFWCDVLERTRAEVPRKSRFEW